VAGELLIDGAHDAGKASQEIFKAVLGDDGFRARKTSLAMKVLYERYRGQKEAAR
jgi:hypothetical protein